jgi:FkbM family methyltransferase
MLKRALRRAKSSIKRTLRGREVIETEIPGQPSIALVAYYDEFAGYYPNCELRTKQWFVDNVLEDWVLFDCGAHIGYFSLLFSRLAPRGRVYAFEPTKTFGMLQKNLLHHDARNVVAVNQALGSRSGRISARIPRIWGHVTDDGTFEFTTIDNYVREHRIERVDCIKIDVDSYDFDVLMGAEGTLTRFNPALVIELADIALTLREHSTVQVLEWLAGRGYSQGVVLEHCNYLFKRDYDCARHARSPSGMTLYFG